MTDNKAKAQLEAAIRELSKSASFENELGIAYATLCGLLYVGEQLEGLRDDLTAAGEPISVTINRIDETISGSLDPEALARALALPRRRSHALMPKIMTYEDRIQERMALLRHERPDETNWVGLVTGEHLDGECIECDALRRLQAEADAAMDDKTPPQIALVPCKLVFTNIDDGLCSIPPRNPSEVERGPFNQGVVIECVDDRAEIRARARSQGVNAEDWTPARRPGTGGVQIVDVATRKVIAFASQTNEGWPTSWTIADDEFGPSFSSVFMHAYVPTEDAAEA